VSVNLCSKTGVQLGLLLLPLVIGSLWGRVLVGVVASQSRAACRFQRHSCLDELVGKLVGLMDGAGGLAGRLIGGFDVRRASGRDGRLLVGILGTGGCGCMERVILLLSLQWFVGSLGGACTLQTRCVLGVTAGVVISSIFLGCACK
jgi:hypothetical protein